MPILNKLAASSRAGGSTPLRSNPRTALTAFFALDGFVFAGWVVRIPAIKEQTGASATSLGLALLCLSAGAVVTMTLTGRLCRRFGSLRVTIACAALMSLSVLLPPLARSATTLGIVLLLFGAAYGSLSVALNSAAVNVVLAVRRPLMPAFHAAYSLGGMVGAGLGALLAGSLSPTPHLILLATIGLSVTVVAARPLLRHGIPDPTPDPAPGNGTAPRTVHRRMDRRTRRLVLVLGLIALCTAYGEGALADWGALHLEDDLGAHPGVAAAGYSCFALTMTIGRFSGTALLERLGRTRTLVAGGLTASVGMLAGALAPTVWGTLLGFAVTGLGLANLFPVAIERAGALAGPNGIAVASTLGYGGLLLGPPAIGFMADWFTLPSALTSVAVLSAAAALIAYGMRSSDRG
ncbi:MFS transporter [Streptomyces sp. NPDC059816]|uniref:MFS transporter n=1 Tax=Streptomyces sp. NPDC059816 TaxID=3346960 RepID=UPI00364E5FFF